MWIMIFMMRIMKVMKMMIMMMNSPDGLMLMPGAAAPRGTCVSFSPHITPQYTQCIGGDHTAYLQCNRANTVLWPCKYCNRSLKAHILQKRCLVEQKANFFSRPAPFAWSFQGYSTRPYLALRKHAKYNQICQMPYFACVFGRANMIELAISEKIFQIAAQTRWLDKAPRLSISIVIWILSSDTDTICQLNQFNTNSEVAMLSGE